jgi:hypothetical protein
MPHQKIEYGAEKRIQSYIETEYSNHISCEIE